MNKERIETLREQLVVLDKNGLTLQNLQLLHDAMECPDAKNRSGMFPIHMTEGLIGILEIQRSIGDRAKRLDEVSQVQLTVGETILPILSIHALLMKRIQENGGSHDVLVDEIPAEQDAVLVVANPNKVSLASGAMGAATYYTALYLEGVGDVNATVEKDQEALHLIESMLARLVFTVRNLAMLDIKSALIAIRNISILGLAYTNATGQFNPSIPITTESHTSVLVDMDPEETACALLDKIEQLHNGATIADLGAEPEVN